MCAAISRRRACAPRPHGARVLLPVTQRAAVRAGTTDGSAHDPPPSARGPPRGYYRARPWHVQSPITQRAPAHLGNASNPHISDIVANLLGVSGCCRPQGGRQRPVQGDARRYNIMCAGVHPARLRKTLTRCVAAPVGLLAGGHRQVQRGGSAVGRAYYRTRCRRQENARRQLFECGLVRASFPFGRARHLSAFCLEVSCQEAGMAGVTRQEYTRP